MTEYKCWDEGNTDEDSAEVYKAPNAKWAAENFAKDEFENSSGECGNAIECHVRCPDGTLEIYDVSVDFDPTFCASKRKPAQMTEPKTPLEWIQARADKEFPHSPAIIGRVERAIIAYLTEVMGGAMQISRCAHEYDPHGICIHCMHNGRASTTLDRLAATDISDESRIILALTSQLDAAKSRLAKIDRARGELKAELAKQMSLNEPLIVANQSLAVARDQWREREQVARGDAQKAEIHWVPVGELRPNAGERVHFSTHGVVHLGIYNDGRFWDYERRQHYTITVTHWKPNPLPEPPVDHPERRTTDAVLGMARFADLNEAGAPIPKPGTPDASKGERS